MNPLAPAAIALVFGLICGSFLNAVIHRLPRGIGLARPRRSFCPQCGRSLPWHENIPLLSWIFLRGRCASCGAAIPFRYPLVEALTGAAFFWLWWAFPPAVAAAYMVLVALLIAGTFIDLEHMILPDSLTLGGAAAGVVLAMLVPGLLPGESWEERLRGSLFGAGVGFAVLFAVVELGKLAFGRKRFDLDPPESFAISASGGAPRLKIGEEDWDLAEVFYRPTDVLELHLAEGGCWRLRHDGLVRDGRTASYAEADGWCGTVRAVVVPREAMGFGDVKFMLTLGAFLGWPGALFSIVAGSCIGAVFGVALLALRRLGDAGRIPFGPYLAAGALLWVAAGPEVVRWYLGR
ncbi:MAG: prepilin peptidase [Chthoniobacterales bacterium]|nr:prepilin peptidase [Chthoniobacterales bacterium]